MSARAMKLPPLLGVPRVIPWDAIYPEQKAEHMRVMHGWNGVISAVGLVHLMDHHWRGSLYYHTHDKDPR